MKQELKDKLANLFDNDPSNSNNIFDRIQNQMTSPAVDGKIDSVMEQIKDEGEDASGEDAQRKE